SCLRKTLCLSWRKPPKSSILFAMTNQANPPSHDPVSRPRQRVTPQLLLEAKRLSDPQLHPDGLRVAFVVQEADFEESRWVSHLWLTEWVLPEEEEEEGVQALRRSGVREDASSLPDADADAI